MTRLLLNNKITGITKLSRKGNTFTESFRIINIMNKLVKKIWENHTKHELEKSSREGEGSNPRILRGCRKFLEKNNVEMSIFKFFLSNPQKHNFPFTFPSFFQIKHIFIRLRLSETYMCGGWHGGRRKVTFSTKITNLWFFRRLGKHFEAFLELGKIMRNPKLRSNISKRLFLAVLGGKYF